jgi:hypothetical protein
MGEEAERRNAENGVETRWEGETNQISKSKKKILGIHTCTRQMDNVKVFRAFIRVGKLEHAQYHLRSSLDVRDFDLS